MALHKVSSMSVSDNDIDEVSTNVHHGSLMHSFPYGSRYSSQRSLPHTEIPQEGTTGAAAAQLLQDELDLDGKPNLNLASFVGTYMDPDAQRLIFDNIAKNLSDNDEYPSLMKMHGRCVTMLARLWGASKNEVPVGTATTGSSEAIHLAGLSMKRKWQNSRIAEGKSTSNPNIVMGSHAQVALLKFARYFEVEPRIMPISASTRFGLDARQLDKYVDENTIGIFAILGSTFTGHFDDIEAISNALDEIQKAMGYDIPIHVDAASGGFVAPFLKGNIPWDFGLPRVHSINSSGHKFGLVYAGLGWIVWRDEMHLPKSLIFELDYLGGKLQTYTLSFSRPGAQVIGQYYNFIRLGLRGYRSTIQNSLSNARLFSNQIERTGWFACVSDIHRPKNISHGEIYYLEAEEMFCQGLPVVVFGFSSEFVRKFPNASLHEVSQLLRQAQFMVPCYKLPTDQAFEVLRVVIRESMSRSLLDALFQKISASVKQIMQSMRQLQSEEIPSRGSNVSSDWCCVSRSIDSSSTGTQHTT